jgi:hypothetical protein
MACLALYQAISTLLARFHLLPTFGCCFWTDSRFHILCLLYTPYPQLSHVGISPGPAQSPRGSFNPIPDCIILASIFFTSLYLYTIGTCHLFICAMSVVSFRFRILEYWLPILSSHFMPFMSNCAHTVYTTTLYKHCD